LVWADAAQHIPLIWADAAQQALLLKKRENRKKKTEQVASHEIRIRIELTYNNVKQLRPSA
jgi:hypothetical protein